MNINYNLQKKCKAKAREKVEYDYLEELFSPFSGWTVTPSSQLNVISDEDYIRHDAVINNGKKDIKVEMKSRDIPFDVFSDCYIDKSKIDNIIDKGGGFLFVYYYLSNYVCIWKIDAFERTSWRLTTEKARKNNDSQEKVLKEVYALPFSYAYKIIEKDMSDFPKKFTDSWSDFANAYEVYDDSVQSEIQKYFNNIEKYQGNEDNQ